MTALLDTAPPRIPATTGHLAPPDRRGGWRPHLLTDWLMLLIVPTAAIGSSFGSVRAAGISLYPFKVLVVVLTIVVMTQRRRVPEAGLGGVWAAVILAAWAMVSCIWSVAGPRALQEASIYIFFAGLVVLAIGSLGLHWFPALLLGWPVAVVGTAIIAMWELMTGSHLPSPLVEQFGYGLDRVVLGTFPNPNNAGAFLCLAAGVCAIGWSTVGRRAPGLRLWFGAGFVLAALTLPLTASRFAVLGFLVGAGVFALLVLRARAGQALTLWLAGLFVPAVLVALVAFPALTQKVTSVAPAGEVANSSSIRFNLLRSGLDFVRESRGIGVGAGGFEARMAAGEPRYPVSGAINPHNFWIEITSELGVVGLTSIVVIVLVGLRCARPFGRPSWFGAAYLGTFVAYVFAAMTASSYVNEPVHWTFLACMLALGVHRTLDDEPAIDDDPHRSS